MSDRPDPAEEITAKRRRQIEKIRDECARSLSLAISENSINEEELPLAEQALLEIEVGVKLSQEFSTELQQSNPDLASRIDNILAITMKGLFVCGGLIVTSNTARTLAKKEYNKEHTKPAHEALKARGDWYREAIRFALSQPPSRPLQKRRGANAIAVRAVKRANAWLAEQRQLGKLKDASIVDLTEGAIQKRLIANPSDFPLCDSWQK